MSWLFSRALAEEYSAGISSAGGQFAQLNVTPSPHLFWRNDKMIGACDLSRFGPTCALLTEQDGEAVLASFLAAFPVRTSPSPEMAPDSTELGQAFGSKCGASLARLDPSTSSLKTHQRSLLRGGVRVIGDLASMGYDCRWGIISAADAIWFNCDPVLDHLRERIWIACTRADANSGRREKQWIAELGRIQGARGGFTHGLTGSWIRRGPSGIAEPFGCGQGPDASVLQQGEQREHAGTDAARSLRASRDEQTPDAGDRATEGNPEVANADSVAGRIESKRKPKRRDPASTGDARETSPDAYGIGSAARISGSIPWDERIAGESVDDYTEGRHGWWTAEPDVGRVADGVASRVDRLKCTGNGQVPAVVALAWSILG